MSKQTVLITSLNIFAHFGIKGVSMSQIADSIRISKRTLYSYFGSKDELVCACMDYENENVSDILDEVEKQSKNPMELIVSLTIKINQHRSSYCPAFYKDIQHFYNANIKLNAVYERVRNRIADYFKDGVEKGLFLPECNYDFITHVFMEQMVIQNKSRISLLHRKTVFFTFLRGLCTGKGISVLEELIPAEDEVYACDYDYEYDF
ncbi:MAG: TetR/AcrR family transcriptional regulator [Tannerella sp.]|jgi:AcrR family transcriptional regulator|nr:TetR/AcrR family transcriptional regulator [Tannerella sp.]